MTAISGTFSHSVAALQQKEAAYERVIQQFEQWEADMAPSFTQVERFMNELGFKEDPSFLLDAYSLMKDVKKEVKKKHELTIEAGRLKKHRRTFEERVSMLLPVNQSQDLSISDALHTLRKNIEREKEIEKQKRKLKQIFIIQRNRCLNLSKKYSISTHRLNSYLPRPLQKTEMRFCHSRHQQAIEGYGEQASSRKRTASRRVPGGT